ncbi:hypothetical protein [Thermosulfurimonas sp. F29]|uniref:hypothetical protein n=1 Tax=Thermosulfurimonas sp. F29 TaxID=2867247 RepID=UPI001C83892A|nr:hypothetical protein [Thermosulfurimonas sp. F29]MBX6423422.1 hypothetical protein [Thermosulfurimonas sp. F29]
MRRSRVAELVRTGKLDPGISGEELIREAGRLLGEEDFDRMKLRGEGALFAREMGAGLLVNGLRRLFEETCNGPKGVRFQGTVEIDVGAPAWFNYDRRSVYVNFAYALSFDRKAFLGLLYHENCHVVWSRLPEDPEERKRIFGDPLLRNLVNLLEDRRVECRLAERLPQGFLCVERAHRVFLARMRGDEAVERYGPAALFYAASFADLADVYVSLGDLPRRRMEEGLRSAALRERLADSGVELSEFRELIGDLARTARRCAERCQSLAETAREAEAFLARWRETLAKLFPRHEAERGFSRGIPGLEGEASFNEEGKAFEPDPEGTFDVDAPDASCPSDEPDNDDTPDDVEPLRTMKDGEEEGLRRLLQRFAGSRLGRCRLVPARELGGAEPDEEHVRAVAEGRRTAQRLLRRFPMVRMMPKTVWTPDVVGERLDVRSLVRSAEENGLPACWLRQETIREPLPLPVCDVVLDTSGSMYGKPLREGVFWGAFFMEVSRRLAPLAEARVFATRMVGGERMLARMERFEDLERLQTGGTDGFAVYDALVPDKPETIFVVTDGAFMSQEDQEVWVRVGRRCRVIGLYCGDEGDLPKVKELLSPVCRQVVLASDREAMVRLVTAVLRRFRDRVRRNELVRRRFRTGVVLTN